MTTILDGTVAILWGDKTRELNWIHLSPKHGRVSVANVRESGFWVRDLHGDCPGIEYVAAEAYASWEALRDGEDMSAWATHRLALPLMRDIEPIEQPVSARDLLGIAPDWTGGMSSVDWVREQRDRS